MANIKRKQIAFNLDDPLQYELYQHVEKYKNFSYYGKSLVQKDYEAKRKERQVQKNNSDIMVKVGRNQKYL